MLVCRMNFAGKFTNNMTKQAKVRNVAAQLGKTAQTYSGRGMFGVKCMAIVGTNSTAIIERAAFLGLTGAKIDNMGLDYVVYWPQIQPD